MNIEELKQLYFDEEKSIVEIADIFGTYPNKIARILKKNGYQLRDKSTAQKNALKKGTTTHPTEGKERSEKEKNKISNSMHKSWKDMSDDKRDERKQMAKEQWDKMTDEQKEELRNLAHQALRKTASEGSKMEKFLKIGLQDAGFDVILHQRGLVPNTSLEVDLHVPEIRTIIEVDGPSHFIDIWGKETLDKNMRADQEKTGLFLSRGFCVIRLKHIQKSDSNYLYRTTLAKVLKVVKKIKRSFPPIGQRYIELEAM